METRNKQVKIEKAAETSAEKDIPFVDEAGRGVSAGDDVFKIENLTMAYGDYVVMRDLNFSVKKGEIFFIMGGSGCGKSTLLRHMIGLIKPSKGKIFFRGQNFSDAPENEKTKMLRQFGVLYQGGALWSSMTLAENVSLPLREFTKISSRDAADIVDLKLSLVGLNGFGSFYPSEISGGMCKRAGLARAIALDPLVLFFDEPSAGLDPVSSHRLDELSYSAFSRRDIVIVSPNWRAFSTSPTEPFFLIPNTRTQAAIGAPKDLINSDNKYLRVFLNRGFDPCQGK